MPAESIYFRLANICFYAKFCGVWDFLIYLFDYRMKNKLRFGFFFTFLFLVGVLHTFAQVPPPPSGGGTGSPSCWPPPCVPIDGGISALIVAGAALGAKKLVDSKKKSQQI